MAALKEIFKISKGKKEEETEEGSKLSRRYIQIEDLRHNDNLKYCIPNKKSVHVNKDDLIIAWDGANAGTIGVGLEGVIGSTLARLELKNNKVNPYYAARFLQSKFQYLRDNCTGATIPHISKTVLENLSIPLPPLETQKKIVEVLDKAQRLIDARKEQIRLMDELIQSVFYEMFGDPVTNPKGWENQRLDSICTKIGSGATPRGGKSSYKAEGISLIRSMNVHNGAFKYDELAFIDNTQAKKLNNVIVEQSDVLLNITGASVARSCIVPEKILPARVNQHVSIIRVNKEKANSRYINNLFINWNYNRKKRKNFK